MRRDEQFKYCNALEESPSPSKFRKKIDGKQMVVKRTGYGTFLPKIIFEESLAITVY
jgi:hypothetical protein